MGVRVFGVSVSGFGWVAEGLKFKFLFKFACCTLCSVNKHLTFISSSSFLFGQIEIATDSE